MFKVHNQEKLLHKIAVAMGATIGMSYLLFLAYVIFDFPFVFQLSWLLFLIQECVIAANFLCTKKMKQMCKEYISKD